MTNTLTNPDASPEAVALFAYLNECFGKKTLTAQHTKTREQAELWKIKEVTGKLPAICGFELLGYSPNINYTDTDEDALKEILENVNTIDKAIEWALVHKGIVTYTWHWYSPLRGHNKSFYTRFADFDLTAALTAGTAENKALLRDLDLVADWLKRFRDLKIPILWRPLHEADGGWFWWGARGPEPFLELWHLMYERFSRLHKLNNLIWVWNSPLAEWYPGDDVVDIISRDFYASHDGALKEEFEELKKISPEKIAALGECDCIPDPDKMQDEKALWAWFMIWCDPFILTEKYMTYDYLKKTYQHPLLVTLEDLPSYYFTD